jgi:type IV pilus assembly protein PilY1
MTRRLILILVSAWLAGAATTARAAFDPVNDDTDIFLANPAFASTRPNVLIFVDNTANWSQSTGVGTKYDGVRAALKAVLRNTVTDAYNVGMAMFVETGSPNNSVDGAYVRYGVRQMTGTEADTSSNKGKLIKSIDALSENGDKGNNATFSLAMGEMFNYFAGRTTYSGHGKDKADADESVYVTGSTPARQSHAGSPLGAGVLPAPTGTSSASAYISPIVDGCQKNFIIFISNGEASDNSASLAEAASLYQSQTGTVPGTISLSPSGSEGILSDEYAKYMANSDCNTSPSLPGIQTVSTYTIDVLPKTTGGGPAHTALLKSMAINGKGKYFAITDMSNTSQIETALTTIFQEVQSVNNVFASTTLPVSVNVRGTNLNQVYIGVFRPDSAKSPRWFGNLKLYKLAVDSATETLFLADRLGVKAEDEQSGFISTTASSFWNDRNNVDFWKFRDAAQNGPGGANEMADGNLVEKGGVAQQLRANNKTDQSLRQVYTCTGSDTGGLCFPGEKLASTPFVENDDTIVGAADVGAYATVAVTSLRSVPDASPATSATVTVDTAAAHGLIAGNTVRIEGAQPAVYNGDFTVIAPVYPSVVTRDALSLGHLLGTATLTTTVAHGFNNGDTITITGANEAGYNKTAIIANAAGSTFTYDVDAALATPATGAIRATRLPRLTYSVPVSPAANRARATTASANALSSADLVFIDTSPDSYDTAGAGSGVTVVNSTTFEYTAGSIAGPHTGPVVTAKARKTISSLSGSGTTAGATVPSHGYGTVGSSVANITIAGANETAFNTVAPVTITITSVDSFSYTTPATITGTTNTAQARVTGHTFSTGGYVHIRGNSLAAYNTITGTTVGTPHTVSGTQGVFFTFASTETTTGTGGAAGVAVTNITYPGGGSDVATVTTATAHGFILSPATSFRFFGTGANYAASGACSGYDNQSFTVQSTPAANQFTINAAKNCPKGVTGTTGAVPNGTIVGFLIDVAGTGFGINPIVSATGSPYVERNLTISSIVPLSTASGSITAGNPAVADPTARDAIVNWVRGQDNKDNENIDCTGSPFYPCDALTSVGTTPRLTDVRSSIHSDVLHSRPATVNYSRFPTDLSQPANDNDVYVFYGSNGGMLHAIKGGTTGGGPDDEPLVLPGDERWAFLPKEFFPKLKRLRDNTPLISNLTQKDYFFDGSIGVYQNDVMPLDPVTLAPTGRVGTIGDDPGDKVHLYVSLRRGGDFIYALDVTEPDRPLLLWRRGSTDSGWEELAQTWSEPRVSRVKLDATIAATAMPGNPDGVVLIFGAGYDDAVEDINPCLLREFNATDVVQLAIGSGTVTYTSGGSCVINSPTGSTTVFTRKRGRGIFVVDAFSGTVLWRVGPEAYGNATYELKHPDMTCSISSDISVLENRNTRVAQALYVGDTCGNVWRADVTSETPEKWAVTKIAALSTGSSSDIAGKRKFLFPPDIVLSKDSLGSHFAVLLGSGDREHPFDTTVQNSFFMVKDRGAENTTTYSIAAGPSSSDLPVAFTDVFNATNVDGVNDFGWRIDLLPGEKNVGSAVTVSGTTFFNTNQPSSTAGGGACGSNLGIARQYLVSYTDASATKDLNGLGSLSTANRSKIHSGGGYLPSPVPIVVEIDGKKHQVVCSGIVCTNPGGLTLDARLRTYWYKEIDQ